jgi:cytochrome oxidase Cu insertion factor (SCO1/SenC/PrrC family)
MGLTIGAVAVLSAGVWLAVGVLIRPGSAPLRPSAAPGASTQVVAGSLEDLLMELQLVPMEGQMPKAFDLPSLEGRRVALADLAGRPTLLYFWATW